MIPNSNNLFKKSSFLESGKIIFFIINIIIELYIINDIYTIKQVSTNDLILIILIPEKNKIEYMLIIYFK